MHKGEYALYLCSVRSRVHCGSSHKRDRKCLRHVSPSDPAISSVHKLVSYPNCETTAQIGLYIHRGQDKSKAC